MWPIFRIIFKNIDYPLRMNIFENGQGYIQFEIRGMKKLNTMFTLEKRRAREELIQLFKLLKQGDTEGQNFCTGNNNRKRGHRLKLNKASFNRNCRKHYFLIE